VRDLGDALDHPRHADERPDDAEQPQHEGTGLRHLLEQRVRELQIGVAGRERDVALIEILADQVEICREQRDFTRRRDAGADQRRAAARHGEQEAEREREQRQHPAVVLAVVRVRGALVDEAVVHAARRHVQVRLGQLDDPGHAEDRQAAVDDVRARRVQIVELLVQLPAQERGQRAGLVAPQLEQAGRRSGRGRHAAPGRAIEEHLEHRVLREGDLPGRLERLARLLDDGRGAAAPGVILDRLQQPIMGRADLLALIDRVSQRGDVAARGSLVAVAAGLRGRLREPVALELRVQPGLALCQEAERDGAALVIEAGQEARRLGAAERELGGKHPLDLGRVRIPPGGLGAGALAGARRRHDQIMELGLRALEAVARDQRVDRLLDHRAPAGRARVEAPGIEARGGLGLGGHAALVLLPLQLLDRWRELAEHRIVGLPRSERRLAELRAQRPELRAHLRVAHRLGRPCQVMAGEQRWQVIAALGRRARPDRDVDRRDHLATVDDLDRDDPSARLIDRHRDRRRRGKAGPPRDDATRAALAQAIQQAPVHGRPRLVGRRLEAWHRDDVHGPRGAPRAIEHDLGRRAEAPRLDRGGERGHLQRARACRRRDHRAVEHRQELHAQPRRERGLEQVAQRILRIVQPRAQRVALGGRDRLEQRQQRRLALLEARDVVRGDGV
jgi:hypothetical protein